MNWIQFKDPVSDTCLGGTVAASWSLTQKVAGLNHFTVMTNSVGVPRATWCLKRHGSLYLPVKNINLGYN